MRRSSVAGVSLLAIALVGAVAFAAIRARSDEAQGLVVSPSRIDWGEVPLGEHREATLTLENRGRRAVLVGNPVPSCACIFVIPPAPSGILSPGAKTTFRVGLDPSKTDPRRFHKTFTIVSDDAVSPHIEIPVDGEVLLYRRWSAVTQDFHAVELGKGAPRFGFQLRRGEGFEAHVEDAVSSDPRFSVEVVQVDGGSDVVVRPQAAVGLGKGAVRAEITVKVVVTGHGKPPITLMDTLTVTADLR